jgi:hypothetical protein
MTSGYIHTNGAHKNNATITTVMFIGLNKTNTKHMDAARGKQCGKTNVF